MDARLVNLRVSVARLAQQLKVETDTLPVLDASFAELCVMARDQDRGWNTLIGLCMDNVEYLLVLEANCSGCT